MEQCKENSWNICFEQLVQSIIDVDDKAQTAAIKAVNRMATLRNWIIGGYIVEYEQHGNDRAKYGERLIEQLVLRLKGRKYNTTLLKNSRLFYLEYPNVGECLGKNPTLSDFSYGLNLQLPVGRDSSSVSLSTSPTSSDKFTVPAETLINKLSFSHIVELLTIKEPLIRFFYEIECMKGTWSVRELRRQITSNLHVRIGLTKDKLQLMNRIDDRAEQQTVALQLFVATYQLQLPNRQELEEFIISECNK